MDCSLQASSVHGMLQARILEWVAIPVSRGSSRPRDWTQVFCTAGRFFTIWATREPSDAKEAKADWFFEDLQDLLELTPKKVILLFQGDWNAKVGSQETPGVTGKFGLGVQNEAGQRLIEFCQENILVIANTYYSNTRDDSTHRHHQLVNIEIRLIVFFAAKDGEAL